MYQTLSLKIQGFRNKNKAYPSKTAPKKIIRAKAIFDGNFFNLSMNNLFRFLDKDFFYI